MSNIIDQHQCATAKTKDLHLSTYQNHVVTSSLKTNFLKPEKKLDSLISHQKYLQIQLELKTHLHAITYPKDLQNS